MASLNDFQEQLDILSATKTAIKEAIIGKGQEVASADSFSSYADKIDEIVTLNEGTVDANATAQDIAYNKTAYVNGTKVTGSIETIGPHEEISGMLMDATTVQTTTIYDEHDNPYPGIQYTFLASGNTLTRDGADVSTNAKYSDIVSALSGTADRISADKIKSGETILGVAGNVIELNGDTETVTPTTSQQVITPTSPKNALTQVTVNAVTSAIDNNIQAGNIKKGVTILGVSGKSSVVDTDNANATANDIIYSKTAYVNGNKITGRMIKHVGDSTYANQLSAPDNTDHFNINYDSANDKIYIGSLKIGSGYWDGTALSNAYIDKNLVYTRLGLTANKIKKGVTILGITGTYITPMKEYVSETAMNNDIANIQEGEVVKVVASGTTTHYIKETTMKKLVKEEDTISPQEYTENVGLANDILGEGESE